jgi:hypothetical protein
MPALTTSADPMMKTISSAKPLNASSAGIRPLNTPPQQPEHRDQIVAKPPPDEQDHDGADQPEGQRLLRVHAASQPKVTARRTPTRVARSLGDGRRSVRKRTTPRACASG